MTTATAPTPADTDTLYQTRIGMIDGVEIRDINNDNRTATFVAATETPVETWYGPESLRMSGVDLKRYRKNPVILDSHNRWSASAIIGKAIKVRVEKRELLVDVEFADTETADEVWRLVQGRFLSALSVGFRPQPNGVVVLGEDETHGKGENRITGPARVVTKWELLEISVVSVPADADALRRGLGQTPQRIETLVQRAVTAAMDGIQSKETTPMSTEQRTDADPHAASTPTPTTPTTPTNLPTPAAASTPAATGEAAQPRAASELTDTERRVRDIHAITPAGYETIASRCILENKTLDETRAALLAEMTKRGKPVGTPEPANPTQTPTNTQDRANDAGEEPSDDVLVRSLCGC